MATTALQACGAEATTKAAAHRVLIDPGGLLPTCLLRGGVVRVNALLQLQAMTPAEPDVDLRASGWSWGCDGKQSNLSFFCGIFG